MKARVKDTGQILEVLSVKLENGFYYSCDRVEIEKDLSNPIDHWQDLRERAAIAAIQVFCAALASRDTESITIDDATKSAVEIADVLVKKLKGA